MSLTSLHVLPDEILRFFIFERLDETNWPYLALVCQRFSILVRPLLYRNVIITRPEDCDFFLFQSNVDRFIPYAKTLSFDLNPGDVGTIWDPEETSLWTAASIVQLSATIIFLIRNLVHLSTVYMDLSRLSMHATSEEAGIVAWNEMILLFHAFSRLELLNSLTVFFAKSMKDVSLEMLSRGSHGFGQFLKTSNKNNLRSLILIHSPETFLSQLPQAENLDYLKLRHLDMQQEIFGSKSVGVSMRTPPRLKTLVLEVPNQVNFTSLIDLLRPCSNSLKHLTINEACWADDLVLKEPTTFDIFLSALEVFNYHDSYKFKEIAIEVANRIWQLLESCPLQVISCYDVAGPTTKSGLKKLSDDDDRNWPQLRLFATLGSGEGLESYVIEAAHRRAEREGSFEIRMGLRRVSFFRKEMNDAWVKTLVKVRARYIKQTKFIHSLPFVD